MVSRETQIANLQQAFPSTTQIKQDSTQVLLKIDHNLVISSQTEYGLTLFVKVPIKFPQVAPEVTMPYCFHKVSVLPPNSEKDVQWNPNITLVEAVRNGFQNAADLWGPVVPPTMTSISKQLLNEPDRLLQDLISNPNCLDAYCYQLPLVKQMRDSTKETLQEIRRVAEENAKLRPKIEKEAAEVKKLQNELQKQVDYLQKFGGNSLIKSVCTTNDLLNTLENDVKTLNRENDALGKECLALYGKDRRGFQTKLEAYKQKAKEAHILDLKRRSFKQQVQA